MAFRDESTSEGEGDEEKILCCEYVRGNMVMLVADEAFSFQRMSGEERKEKRLQMRVAQPCTYRECRTTTRSQKKEEQARKTGIILSPAAQRERGAIIS